MAAAAGRARHRELDGDRKSMILPTPWQRFEQPSLSSGGAIFAALDKKRIHAPTRRDQSC
jgi:hypothetical protein